MIATAALAPHETIWSLANSIVPTRCLYLVAELGLADLVGEEGAAIGDLASKTQADPEALTRVVRLLAAFGIFELVASEVRHTEASRLLRSDHPMSMRAFAQLNSLPLVWAALGALGHSLRTGQPAVATIAPEGFFAYLQAHPEEARVFDHAMAAKGRTDIAGILGAYDFRTFATIADVGGGRGHLLQAILEASPATSGILFDLPEVVSRLEISSERLVLQAGDFFAGSLPAADLYVLMEVIHDWDDQRAVKILSGIRAAAEPGSAVLVIEDVAPEDGEDPRGLTLDVLMLAVTGGRERTPSQHAALLKRAGFRMTKVIDTAGPMRIVEAVAV